MSKKYVVIGTVLLIILLGAAGGYFLFNRNNSTETDETSLTSFGSSLATNDSKFNDPLTDFEDESGYSFSYPETLKLKDVTPDDENYYSSLELSKDGQMMKVNITVGNIDPYKTNKSASLVGSTTLGGISSNQYSLNGRLFTVAIDQGVLYVIDSPKDNGFWEDAQAKVVSSFKFAGQPAAGTGAVDTNTEYEEETVE